MEKKLIIFTILSVLILCFACLPLGRASVANACDLADKYTNDPSQAVLYTTPVHAGPVADFAVSSLTPFQYGKSITFLGVSRCYDGTGATHLCKDNSLYGQTPATYTWIGGSYTNNTSLNFNSIFYSATTVNLSVCDAYVCCQTSQPFSEAPAASKLPNYKEISPFQ